MEGGENSPTFSLKEKKKHIYYLEKLTLKITLLTKFKEQKIKYTFCVLLLLSQFQFLIMNLLIVSLYIIPVSQDHKNATTNQIW